MLTRPRLAAQSWRSFTPRRTARTVGRDSWTPPSWTSGLSTQSGPRCLQRWPGWVPQKLSRGMLGRWSPEGADTHTRTYRAAVG
eukprot:7641082-Alexandrium_andersonii.AAC.1